MCLRVLELSGATSLCVSEVSDNQPPREQRHDRNHPDLHLGLEADSLPDRNLHVHRQLATL